MEDSITEKEIQNIIGEQQIVIYKLTREYNKLLVEFTKLKEQKK